MTSIDDNSSLAGKVNDMQIYMFRSETKRELRAFAGDRGGSQLPDRFAPWHVTGVITPDRKPPHNLSRETIERAINDQGFQLWRMKPET